MSNLPAVIRRDPPFYFGIRVSFSAVSVPPAVNRNDTDWAGKYELGVPFVSQDRRVNGNKPTGTMEDFRIVVWTDPKDANRHVVGLLKEIWAYGAQMRGMPTISLWEHTAYTTRADAVNAGVRLFQDNTFGTLKEQIEKRGLIRLTTNPDDMPFRKPAHWRRYAARGLISAIK